MPPRISPSIRLPRRLLPKRHASSTPTPTPTPSPRFSPSPLLLTTAIASSLTLSYLYVTDTRASFHRWLLPPLLRWTFPDAEDAHHATTRALHLLHSLKLHPRERNPQDAECTIFDAPVKNPIGISAGLDKQGQIPDALFALGPSLVEIGGCTPRPQDGNPRPRLFRIPTLEGLVNRYGLNSAGADAVARNLRLRVRRFARDSSLDERHVLDGKAGVPPGSLLEGRLLAVQIAKNKDTDERDEEAVVADHIYCLRKLAPYADIIVVNVSSPNTPGLRNLQETGPLTKLLTKIVAQASQLNAQTPTRPPLRIMVKVSPDEDSAPQIKGIVEAVHKSGASGLIVGNTTKRRHDLHHPADTKLPPHERRSLAEEGGYSGPALFARTLDLVSRYRSALDARSLAEGGSAERKVIFATGGIRNGEEVVRVLNAGASLAMVYTGLVYGGAGTVTRMKAEMRAAGG